MQVGEIDRLMEIGIILNFHMDKIELIQIFVRGVLMDYFHCLIFGPVNETRLAEGQLEVKIRVLDNLLEEMGQLLLRMVDIYHPPETGVGN